VANQAGGSGTVDSRALSIVTDVSGNIYTTGFFNGQVDFDPGPGIYNMSPADSIDVYVSKMDSARQICMGKAVE
jgi:hypothetical protein